MEENYARCSWMNKNMDEFYYECWQQTLFLQKFEQKK
jgi:hypothetical protein